MRNMIHRIQYLLLLAIAFLSMGSCAENPAQDASQGKQINLGLNLGTYALGDDDPNAYPHEKKISNLYVFIYNSQGLLENLNNTKVSPASDGSLVDASGRVNGTWRVYEGAKQIYVLANVADPNHMLSAANDTWLPTNMLDNPTIDMLKDICTVDHFFDSNYFENQHNGTWKGGLMSGSKTVDVSAATDDVTIPLHRRYARIDLQVRKAPELADATVTIEGGAFNAFARQMTLLQRVPEWDWTLYGTVSFQSSLTVGWEYARVDTRIDGGSNDGESFELYSAPYLASIAQAGGQIIHLELKVKVNGRDEIYTIYLVRTGPDGKQDLTQPLDVEGNKIYKINATLNRRSVDVDIKIMDWDDQNIQGDIAGSTLSVSESRVVMDWWNLGQKFDTGVDYASDGNVKFVGYVIKRDDGTDESVTTDGRNLPTWLPKNKITNLPDGSAKNGRIGLEYVMTSEQTHPDVYLRLRTGNIIKDIKVVYDNGLIPNAIITVNGWPTRQPGIGVYLAKRGNSLPFGTAATVDLRSQWSPNTTVSVTEARDRLTGSGIINTSEIIAALGDDAMAANYCAALGQNWYLSSEAELKTLFQQQCQNVLGPSYSIDPDNYWSSSESNLQSSYVVTSVGSFSTINYKPEMYKLRCVRNIGIDLSKSLLIADWYDWGQSFSTDVEFNSLIGAISVYSIDNGSPDKSWLKSAVVSGTEKGKIRITYEPTADSHSDVQIVLQASNGGIATIRVKYGNGFIPNSVLRAQGWTTDLPDKGLLLAKRGNFIGDEIAPPDDERLSWAPTSTVMIGTSSLVGTGLSNTNAIVGALGTAGAPAAFRCQSIGTGWYLPSKEELEIMYALRSYAGGSYGFGIGMYWSSTESADWRCYYRSFVPNSTMTDNPKSVITNTRCVRNI